MPLRDVPPGQWATVNLLGLYRPLLVVGHGNDGMTAVTTKPYWPTDEFEALLPSDYRLASEEPPGLFDVIAVCKDCMRKVFGPPPWGTTLIGLGDRACEDCGKMTPGRDLVKPYRGEYNRRKENP